MTSKAIVIVDDEAIILLSLKQLVMSHFGGRFRCETALDGSSALALVDQCVSRGVDVIIVISDWLMPGVKGDELLKAVYAKHPGIKLVMVTGQADTAVIEELRREVRLEGVIAKPWKSADLLDLLDRCVLEAS